MTDDMRKLGAEFIQAANRASQYLPSVPLAGKGIVTCAGGNTYFTNAYVLIRKLREVGCSLPIQVWYIGSSELDTTMMSILTEYDVECIDASKKRTNDYKKDGWLEGWAVKALAIFESSFQEILFLDSDNYPLRNPEYLFQTTQYRKMGAVFWPDVSKSIDPSIYPLLDISPIVGPEIESGQMLFDKQRCSQALYLALWINQHLESFSKFLYGDKDTFRLAFEKIGTSYHLIETSPEFLQNKHDTQSVLGVLNQHDCDGRLLFQHRTVSKWRMFGANARIAGALCEPEAISLIRDLRSKWSGKVGNQTGEKSNFPKRLEGVFIIHKPQEAMEEVINPGSPEQGEAKIIRRNDNDYSWWEVEFEENGTIKSTPHPDTVFWETTVVGGIPILRLLDAEQNVKFEFECKEGSQWCGNWLFNGSLIPVKLQPLLHAFAGVSAAQEKLLPVRIADNEAHSIFVRQGGIGDDVLGIYAGVGLANMGYDIKYHTKFSEWFSRIHHPGLEIVGEFPPSSAIDLNRQEPAQARYAHNRAYWYAATINPSACPASPSKIRLSSNLELDIGKYVVLAPISGKSSRNWLVAHWQKLSFYLDEMGLSVLAIGTASQKPSLEAMFENTLVMTIAGCEPVSVVDIVLKSVAVIGLDSGITHIAALFNKPTFAIHSQLPATMVFHPGTVTSIVPKMHCRFCRWQQDKGYLKICEQQCSALASISPETVITKIRDSPIGEDRNV